jgi:hypothetical protein
LEWIFYSKDNTATFGTDRLNFNGQAYKKYVNTGENKFAFLYGRYQIERKCTKHCQEFRFGATMKSLKEGYSSVQAQIKFLSTCGFYCSLGILVLLACYYKFNLTIS